MDFKDVFPKNDRRWGNIVEENQTDSQKRASRADYERQIAFMEQMREKQTELENKLQDELAAAQKNVHKLTEMARVEIKKASEKVKVIEQRVVQTLDKAQRSYIEKMRKRYMKNGKIEHIPMMCKNHCLGPREDCWAHDNVDEKDKVCPFIHRNDAAWDSSKCKAVKNTTRKK
jgi:hypothetical protein